MMIKNLLTVLSLLLTLNSLAGQGPDPQTIAKSLQGYFKEEKTLSLAQQAMHGYSQPVAAGVKDANLKAEEAQKLNQPIKVKLVSFHEAKFKLEGLAAEAFEVKESTYLVGVAFVPQEWDDPTFLDPNSANYLSEKKGLYHMLPNLIHQDLLREWAKSEKDTVTIQHTLFDVSPTYTIEIDLTPLKSNYKNSLTDSSPDWPMTNTKIVPYDYTLPKDVNFREISPGTYIPTLAPRDYDELYALETGLFSPDGPLEKAYVPSRVPFSSIDGCSASSLPPVLTGTNVIAAAQQNLQQAFN